RSETPPTRQVRVGAHRRARRVSRSEDRARSALESPPLALMTATSTVGTLVGAQQYGCQAGSSETPSVWWERRASSPGLPVITTASNSSAVATTQASTAEPAR